MENRTFSLRLCIDSFHRYWIKWLLHMNMDLPQTDTQVIVLLHMQLLSHLVKTKGVTDYYFSWWPSVLVSSVFLLYYDKTTNVKLKAEEQISPWIWRWWVSAAVHEDSNSQKQSERNSPTSGRECDSEAVSHSDCDPIRSISDDH